MESRGIRVVKGGESNSYQAFRSCLVNPADIWLLGSSNLFSFSEMALFIVTYDTSSLSVDQVFKGFAGFIALGVEAAATLIISFGALEALYGSIHVIARGLTRPG